MAQVPPPPDGTPTAESLVYRDITPIPDVWRNYAIPPADDDPLIGESTEPPTIATLAP